METIRHEGTVLSVADGHARVRIVQASGCAGCQVRQMCMSADTRVKEVDCLVEGAPLQVGDEVNVTETQQMAWRAVLLAYVLPLVVMLTVVVALTHYMGSEVWAAVVALVALAVYYLVLSQFAGRLQRKFTFVACKS